ncbi:hypothetical protein M3Y98_00339000 [Aphelenchoides besseyi]|nr:hypothetical protein M3Y98_00339000 [Aphelenchoides besseyi]
MTQLLKIKMVDGEAEFELSENVLTESSIKHAFLLPSDAIVSLYYVVDGRRRYCQINEAGICFVLPNDWPNRQFFATSNASSRPGSVMNRDPPRIIDKPSVSPTDEAVPRKRAKIVEQTESNAKDLQWFQSLQQYALFYEGDNKAKRCITPLTKQIVDASVLSRCVVQIQFLAVYLSLGDMSAFNFGSNNHSNPIIVDFMMSDYVDPKPKFLNDANTFAASAGECNAMVDKISSADRLNIAKTSIEEWQRRLLMLMAVTKTLRRNLPKGRRLLSDAIITKNTAKVVKKDNAIDVIILQAVSENFLEHNPPTAVPEIGTRYLMLGLSNTENRNDPFSLGCGNVTAIGCSGGDSGAGLWNSSGALIGMNILVKQNPLHVKKTADNRQKQFTHAIGGATVFCSCAGTIELFASEYIPAESPIPFEE